MQLQFGDLVLIKGKHSLIGKIISLFSRGEYSHSAICLDSIHLVSAQPTGIKIYHLDNNIKEFDAFRVDMTVEQKERLRKYIYKNINDKYEYLELVRFILERYLNIKTKFLNRKNKYICSEFCLKCFSRSGVELLHKNEYTIISPSDLAKSEKLTKIN